MTGEKDRIGFYDSARATRHSPVDPRSGFSLSGRYVAIARAPRVVIDGNMGCRVLDNQTWREWNFSSPKEAICALPKLQTAFPGKILWEAVAENLIVNVGLDSALDSGVSGQTWYLGLKSTGTAVAADTMSSHGSWTEKTDYTQSTRPAWGESASASQVVTNSSPVVFSVNGTVTVAGIFATSESTKSGTTGTLLSAADFAEGNQSLVTGATLNVTYTITGASS